MHQACPDYRAGVWLPLGSSSRAKPGDSKRGTGLASPLAQSSVLGLPGDWGMLCGRAHPEQCKAGLKLGTVWSLSEDFCAGNLAVMLESLQAGPGLAGASIQQGGAGGGEWQG